MKANKLFFSAIAFFVVVFVAATSDAADRSILGVEVADEITVAGKHLVLNGVGVRKATFLKIKVYVASLYVERKSQDPDTLLADNELMLLRMDFVRSVSAEKLRSGWSDGFQKAPAYSAALKSKVDIFNAAMVDISEGDRMSILFEKEGAKLEMPGGKEIIIDGEDFRTALLQIWLGPEPPNADLKDGMLGK